MQVPLLDLKRQYESIKSEIDEAIQRVVDSQYFILGEEVEKFEDQIAEYCDVKHAIGVASGTDALLLSLRATGVGEGKNDKVITTPFTFFATAGAIINAGATPVFVDIKPDTFNIDPEKIEELLTHNSQLSTEAKAIIPVHLYGQMADMDPIMKIAEEYDLAVIEDAAQAIGAEYRTTSGWVASSSWHVEEEDNSNLSPQATGNKPLANNSTNHSPLANNSSPQATSNKPQAYRAGSIGHLGCFSFFPTKNLGGYGDGGMIVTDDDEFAEKARKLRVHGSSTKYHHQMVGYNSRLDALQAAILSAKLPYLDKWSEARAENANYYTKELSKVEGITTPTVVNDRNHIYHQYTIRVKEGKRNELQKFLQELGIGTKIYYPLPLHLQECFGHLGYPEGDLPVSETMAREVLALPIYPELAQNELNYVINSIGKFMNVETTQD